MPLSWLKRFTQPLSETSPRPEMPGKPVVPTIDVPPATHNREPARAAAEAREVPTVELVKPAPIELSSDKIAQRAYEKWVARGCTGGSSDQDWLEAEAELRAEYAATPAEMLPHRSR